MCFSLFLIIFLIALLILSIIIIVYWRVKGSSLNSVKNKDYQICDKGNGTLELSTSKAMKEKLVKETGIVLLYVSGSDEFMTLMSAFRNILFQRTSCDVSLFSQKN